MCCDLLPSSVDKNLLWWLRLFNMCTAYFLPVSVRSCCYVHDEFTEIRSLEFRDRNNIVSVSTNIEKMAPKDLKKETARLQLVDEGQWRRVRRQVATQCCDRACTVADIITYCPNDAKLVQENPEIFE
ncbi:unnamed protein product [Spodoptera exigua]|nr:unnamed protein product [Spodoptera exigua]